MKYKNCGKLPRVVYGIKFNPGDVKEVPGYINIKSFVRVFDAENNVSKTKRSYTRKNTATKTNETSKENKSSIIEEPARVEVTEQDSDKGE